ncbi:MAG: NIPSNAP family protein [Aureliella sp.]
MSVAKLGLIAVVLGCVVSQFGYGEESVKRQVMEMRTYTFKDPSGVETFDKYAQTALIPALNRAGIQPVGAFSLAAVQPAVAGAPTDPNAKIIAPPKVMLLLPAASADVIAAANAKVAADEEYQKAAADYLNIPATQPIIDRISSELLVAFNAWPEVKVPKQKKNDLPRLFELRTYESPTEHLGNLKVEMFNSGEVPIFLDCGIQPVFMGQAVVGSLMPNLTYMTVYDDASALTDAWKRFSEHPEWKKLREVKKYEGTVSKIHKSNWEAKPYSQL